MPEIAEYRVDSDQLDFFLSHRKILSMELLEGSFAKKCINMPFKSDIFPLTIKWVRSKAKKMFMCLESPATGKNYWVCFYYGMSGSFSPKKVSSSHIRFTMSDCWVGFNVFYYNDVRKIGWVKFFDTYETYQTELVDMAKQFVFNYNTEEDSEDYNNITFDEFSSNIKTKGKKKYLVSALMDQRSIGAGVGNYLLSEILYDAKLSPWIRCYELTESQHRVLYDSIHKCINLAYEHSGMSMRDYKNINGENGHAEDYLKIYGRKGLTDNNEKIKTETGPHGRTIYTIDED